MASKMVGISIDRGQRLKLETPGGGGYGTPFARNPQAVARDVALGIVSPEHAESDYGVALDSEGGVDANRTKTLRSREAAQ